MQYKDNPQSDIVNCQLGKGGGQTYLGHFPSFTVFYGTPNQIICFC